MKKIFLYLMITFFITNAVYAANWITVKASNGKTALLDTQNIELSNQYVKYWAKITKNGYTYRYYMMSDYTSQTSCIIETYQYDNTGNMIDSSENEICLEKIIPDTLNEALYRKVCEIVHKNPLSIDSEVWSTYLKKINVKVKKVWKPKYSKTKSSNLTDSVLCKIDKNGKIISKEFIKKSNNIKFDKSVEETLNSIITFDPLPKSFENDLDIIITFDYAIKGKIATEIAIMNTNGKGDVSISKSKLHFGEAIGNGLICIIALPFAILGAILQP